MTELLPCPFCGGEASYEYSHDDYNHDCIVCHNDECGASLTCWPYEGEKVTAAWNRRVDARQLALKTRVCPMCEDCPDGCPVETPKDSRNIVANADRIRSMTDEELAEVSVYSTTRPDFDEGLDGEWYECGNIETWHSVFTADLYDSPDDAISYVLEWLQRPVKEE